MGTDDQNVMDQGGTGGIVGIGLSVAEGDPLGDADGLGEGLGERLGDGEGTGVGDATMAGINFALLVVSFRTGSTRGFGLGGGGTTAAAEGVDTGLALWGSCFRLTAPTAADPATMTARAAAVTRSLVVTNGAVIAGAAVEAAARSEAGCSSRPSSPPRPLNGAVKKKTNAPRPCRPVTPSQARRKLPLARWIRALA
jgi:hypothetical protein